MVFILICLNVNEYVSPYIQTQLFYWILSGLRCENRKYAYFKLKSVQPSVPS